MSLSQHRYVAILYQTSVLCCRERFGLDDSAGTKPCFLNAMGRRKRFADDSQASEDAQPSSPPVIEANVVVHRSMHVRFCEWLYGGPHTICFMGRDGSGLVPPPPPGWTSIVSCGPPM